MNPSPCLIIQADYFNWYPGEPTNADLEHAHCVAIAYGSGRWWDVECDAILPPICTKSPGKTIHQNST